MLDLVVGQVAQPLAGDHGLPAVPRGQPDHQHGQQGQPDREEHRVLAELGLAGGLLLVGPFGRGFLVAFGPAGRRLSGLGHGFDLGRGGGRLLRFGLAAGRLGLVRPKVRLVVGVLGQEGV